MSLYKYSYYITTHINRTSTNQSTLIPIWNPHHYYHQSTHLYIETWLWIRTNA